MGVKHRITVIDDGSLGVTIGDAFIQFIQEKEMLGLVPKTINNYEKSFYYFVELELDGDLDTPAEDIMKIVVQQWVESMRQKDMRITTINSYLRDVRTFLYWCMDEDREYIFPSYKIPLVKGQEPLPKIFTDEEVALLIQEPTNKYDFIEWRTWAIVNWVLATGNRAATICDIKIGDISFTHKEVVLRHTKNKKIQVIPLSQELEKILKLYIRKCRPNSSGEDWLFCNFADEQLTYNALAHSFSKYCKERGAEHTNIHGLRHYYATSWIRNGGSAEKLQKALGHTQYTMSQNYVKLVDNDLKIDYDKYNPLSAMNARKPKNHRKKVVVES